MKTTSPLSKSRILFLGTVWPEPQSSAAGRRMLGLVSACIAEGGEVWFASASKETPDRDRLEKLGARTRVVALNHSNFDTWMRELQPDIVIFDRFVLEEQFGARVEKSCPSALRVIDTEDLHFLRRRRQKMETQRHDPDCLRELAAIYRSDLSLVISGEEYRLLTEDYGIPRELLLDLPFWYPPVPVATRGFSERKGFVMIGNFRHAPNADGVRWLREEIWPKVRKLLPLAQVDIYGAYPSREIMDLSDLSNGFRVAGPADDALETIARYRVNLAPLRFGAGIKGKISDGWWCGTPVVTTPIGAEGMGTGMPWGGSVGETPEQLAAQAFELHENENAWALARDAGTHIMNVQFDERVQAPRWIQALTLALGERDERRSRNTVGRILWHQTLRSTDYFSRWIELKNAGTIESPRDD